jgi:arabinose-5-phosphate isomerase
MGDALAMAILQARGFKEKDFARHHPDGSIGRTLLLKTKEIMRTGSTNAVADKSVTIKEALMIMIRAQSGSISVVNKSGKLVGVFTDGDLRRQMAKDEHALQKRLETVMTPNPICVRDDALAAEALKIFNERKIDDLIVVDGKYRPVGLIDSQDLPKLKMM